MSTTTNLKLFKHDNPTTNTNQFDVEKALNENWDKVDKNAGEVASKIQTLENKTDAKDTSQDTEIEVLKAENALLKSQIPSATVVGESVHLEDSSNMPCQIMPLGASIQEGTPSIEFESPIESVGDNINLLDLSNAIAKGTSDGITAVKNNDNTYTINGTAGTNGIANVWVLGSYYNTTTLFTIPAGTYTLKDVLLMSYDGTNRTTFKPSLGNPKTVTLENDFNVTGIRIVELVQGVTYTDLKIYPKLEKGSKATAYSPYGQGSIEIYNCNENFWKINNASFTPTVSSWHDFNGLSNMYNNSRYNESKAKIKLKAGNYYISYGKIVNIGTVQTIKIDGSTNGVVLVTGKGAFTLTEDSEIIIRLSVSTANVKASISNVQIVSGTEEKEYIEHQSQTKALYTQQPFRSIGDVKDRFVKQNGVWYEEHSIFRKIFNGTEEISYISQEGNQYVFQITLPGKLLGSNDLRSSHFKVKPSVEWGEDGIVKRDDTSEYIYVYISRSDFRNWLVELYNAGTPLYIDYVLSTPELIECTAEQVEVLESFNTYKNVTNISSDSIGELEVTYSKDIETLLNNISQAVLGGN